MMNGLNAVNDFPIVLYYVVFMCDYRGVFRTSCVGVHLANLGAKNSPLRGHASGDYKEPFYLTFVNSAIKGIKIQMYKIYINYVVMRNGLRYITLIW